VPLPIPPKSTLGSLACPRDRGRLEKRAEVRQGRDAKVRERPERSIDTYRDFLAQAVAGDIAAGEAVRKGLEDLERSPARQCGTLLDARPPVAVQSARGGAGDFNRTPAGSPSVNSTPAASSTALATGAVS
jgi:hypothetical protein